jgi:hypothetical protein
LPVPPNVGLITSGQHVPPVLAVDGYCEVRRASCN